MTVGDWLETSATTKRGRRLCFAHGSIANGDGRRVATAGAQFAVATPAAQQ